MDLLIFCQDREVQPSFTSSLLEDKICLARLYLSDTTCILPVMVNTAMSRQPYLPYNVRHGQQQFILTSSNLLWYVNKCGEQVHVKTRNVEVCKALWDMPFPTSVKSCSIGSKQYHFLCFSIVAKTWRVTFPKSWYIYSVWGDNGGGYCWPTPLLRLGLKLMCSNVQWVQFLKDLQRPHIIRW